MKATRYRSACIWLAIAALAFAYVARAQAGIEHARAYTAPVIEFLTGHQPSNFAGSNDHLRSIDRDSRHGRLALWHHSGSPVWTPALPILFIGLLFPLALLSPFVQLRLAGVPATPSVPSAFQRPPPALTV